MLQFSRDVEATFLERQLKSVESWCQYAEPMADLILEQAPSNPTAQILQGIIQQNFPGLNVEAVDRKVSSYDVCVYVYQKRD